MKSKGGIQKNGKRVFLCLSRSGRRVYIGEASDVARDMAARGAFRPTGWVEIAVWAAISLFVSREISVYLNLAGAVTLVLWIAAVVLLYAVSRGILFLSAWISSRKMRRIQRCGRLFASISGLEREACSQNQRIPDWIYPIKESGT